MPGREMIVLDIDDTLTPQNSWTELTAAMGASVEEHMSLYHRLCSGEIELEDASQRLVAMWRATKNANYGFIQQAFEAMPFRVGAVELAAWLRNNNFRIHLISGSMDLYVATVARRLGVSRWFANTRLEFDSHGELIGLSYRLSQGAVKLSQLRRACREESVDIKNVTVVGDGANDLELFMATSRGVLVTEAPTPDLRKTAWRTVNSLEEVPSVLTEAGASRSSQ